MTTLAMTAGLLATTGPAMAGQDLTIELQNNLPATQQTYPRLTLRATDSLCWYTNDFENGPAAPAGGGYATLNSEVKNTFFSFCNPTWNPLKDGFARWMQFRMVSQAAPGAEWRPVSWGKSSTFFLTYFKLTMDVRGYHFQLAGPGGEALDTPAGPACVRLDPNGMTLNYSGLYRMKVDPAQGGSCPASAGKSHVPSRTVALRVGRTKRVVVGQVVASVDARWRVTDCSSEHFDAGRARIENGPGGSRWQVVDVRGTSTGTERCTLSLVAGDRELLSQRLQIEVR